MAGFLSGVLFLCCCLSLSVAQSPTFQLYLQGVNCKGGDVKSVLKHTTKEDCEQACIKTTKCRAFVSADNKKCYLKARVCEKPVKPGKGSFDTYVMVNTEGVFPYMVQMYSKGFTCSGNDIPGITGADAVECNAKCLPDPNCKGIVYSTAPSCILKSELCKTGVPDDNARSVWRKKYYPDGYVENKNGQVPSRAGSNLLDTLQGTSLAECKAACDNNVQCQTFEYLALLDGDTSSTDNCFLGTSALVKESTNHRARSVYQKLVAPKGFEEVAHGADCPGQPGDKMKGKGTIDACAKGCKKLADCQGFAWDSFGQHGKRCSYKTAICQQTVPSHGMSIFKKI